MHKNCLYIIYYEKAWKPLASGSDFISSADLSVFSLMTMMVKTALLTRITNQTTLDSKMFNKGDPRQCHASIRTPTRPACSRQDLDSNVL